MAKDTSKKKQVIDFTGVEARKMVPEGDHKLKAVEATLEDGDQYPYIAWVLEVQSGAGKGGKLYDNTSLSPKALWRLRTLLEAMGIEVPEGKMTMDLDGWIKDGEEFIGTVEHEKYEGKTKARLVDVFSVDAAGDKDGDDEDEKEAKDADDKDSDEDEEPDFEGMDADELEEFVDEHDLDVDLDEHKKLSKKRAAVKEAWDARDKDDNDGKDKDEKSGTKAVEKLTADEINEMGTKDLQGVIAKFKLGVELDGSTKTKRRTVIKALKAKDLLAA